MNYKRPKWADVELPDFGNLIVLDIGCGPMKRNCSKRYYSIDISQKFKPHIVGDAHALPIKDEVVDVVLLLSVLEHVKSPEKVLEETFGQFIRT
ncbi:hypothetical protein DRP04_10475 [Archaeoglobales archaeon]|nr:MAG: hypothetical protein DRP04_10475 [Archaeoglobales archaeon]